MDTESIQQEPPITLMQVVEQPVEDILTILSTVYCQRRSGSPISYRASSSIPINKSDEEILVRRLKLSTDKVDLCHERLWMSSLKGILVINRSDTSFVRYGFKSEVGYFNILPGMYTLLIPSTNTVEIWSTEPETPCDIYFLPE